MNTAMAWLDVDNFVNAGHEMYAAEQRYFQLLPEFLAAKRDYENSVDRHQKMWAALHDHHEEEVLAMGVNDVVLQPELPHIDLEADDSASDVTEPIHWEEQQLPAIEPDYDADSDTETIAYE